MDSPGPPTEIASQDNIPNRRKRARPVFSCVECRRKKLKCDRSLPCSQCSRLGRANDCIYDDREDDPPANYTQEAPQNSNDAILDLQKRLAEIERQLISTQPGARPLEHTSISNRPTISKFKGGVAKKGTSTRFFNHLNWRALHPELREVHIHISKLTSDPTIMRMLIPLREAFPKAKRGASVLRQVQLDIPLLKQIQAALPERYICTMLVEKYFRTFARLFPLFDAATFIQKSEEIWQHAPESEYMAGTFLPLYAGVLCLASSFENQIGLATTSVNPICESLLPIVETWLSGITGKNRFRIDVVSVNLLVILYKMTQPIRYEQLWLELGDLMHRAIGMGLHRDPSQIGTFSEDEAEQRRWVWFSVAELHLQISMDNSMPAMIDESAITCQLPKMVPKYMETFFLRLEIWKLLVKSTEVIDREALFQKLQPLHAITLSHTGPPIRFHSAALPVEKFIQHVENALFNRVLIYAYRELAYGSITDSLALESTTRLEIISAQLLQLQDLWDPIKTELSIGEAKDYWNLFHSIFRFDIIHSIINLSLQLKLGRIKTQSLILENSKELQRSKILDIVQNSIDCLIRRIKRADKEVKAVLILQLIFTYASTRVEDKNRDIIIEESLRRSISVCHSQLLENLVASTIGGSTPSEDRRMGFSPSLSGFGEPTTTEAQNRELAFLPVSDLTSSMPEFDAGAFEIDTTMTNWFFDI